MGQSGTDGHKVTRVISLDGEGGGVMKQEVRPLDLSLLMDGAKMGGMLSQLYLLHVLVHKAGKGSGSCCVPVGPECWGPLRRAGRECIRTRKVSEK